jgi:YggT family protein
MATVYLDPQSTLARRHYRVVRVAQVIDYLFGILYALLAVRLVLGLINARRGAGFVEFIVGVTRPFYAPFQGIVATDTLDGSHPIVWPLVVAIAAYALLHAGIRGLLRLVDRA